MKRKTVSSLADNGTCEGAQGEQLPRCSHGAALRFSRFDKSSGSSRDFYACSANRDRKLCNLFYWVDEWEKKLRRTSAQFSPRPLFESPTRDKITRYDSVLGINAITDDSSNSQFLFDKESIDIIAKAVSTFTQGSKSKRILCIGTPSIHKTLVNSGIQSVLLDEDARLSSVLPETYRFNMFNGESFGQVLPDDSFSAIILDPPFQPELLPAIFRTLKSTFPESYQGLILLAFPYFNESQVRSSSEEKLHMSDIRLTYRNHKKYTSAIRSPVRLYSSEKRMMSLVSCLDNYEYCKKCDDLRHISNEHCDKCNACTTIAGPKQYVHCNKCERCVKPNSNHCDDCKRCFLSPHPHTDRLA